MEEIYLPLDIIKNNPGFSIDIGCSVGKVVYRPKSLYKNGEIIQKDKIKNNTLGPLHLRLFKRADIEELVQIIKEECDFTAKPGQEVVVAGLGSSAAQARLQESFNISFRVESEHDLGVDAISFLHQQVSSEELFLPEPPGAREEAVRRFKLFQTWIKGTDDSTRLKWELARDDEDEAVSWQPDPTADIYPYLLVVCGSLFPMTKVDKDGSLLNINALFFSGRCIFGLLATLTGEKDFNKLIKMAEESDGQTTNIYGGDLMKLDQKTDTEAEELSKKKDDFYSRMKGDLIVFPFGKPATSDGEVKKGDMVHSVLETACMNLALVVQMTALVNGCKHVFFAGNFWNPPLIHNWLSRELIRKNLESPLEKRLDFRFIRNGGHTSNIGAFIKGAKNQMSKKS